MSFVPSSLRRRVLMNMEYMIARDCDNGRGLFRYPIVFQTGPEECRQQREFITDEIPNEVLLDGHYQFGRNRLYVMRALEQILEYLERDFGLDIEPPHHSGTSGSD